MKLFILAAGKGSRLKSLTRDLPKPLMTIDQKGTTILEYNINCAKKSGLFEEIVVITGYKAPIVVDYLKKIQGIKISTAFNVMYSEFGPISSLWSIKKNVLLNDCVIINGDTLYDDAVFEQLDKCVSTSLFYSKKNIYENDEVKLIIRDKQVERVAKVLDLNKADGVSAGLLLVKGENTRQILYNYICKLYKSKVIWHELINQLVQENIEVYPLEIDSSLWYEIDTIKDYKTYHAQKGKVIPNVNN
ncbi:choline kinase [Natronobacillus azotifigens]|uniref:Sugar phosphate nucleotidyltransferase n=1 Tax=Natronobacillus azotifigens TaxID=472978 RepID=A0A9J6R910_9BACI|nr:sugar phosphate nucleotidyltransferase [Natronobacillus azotifigens]MCZ0702109.1 sugar phosphate nucleotidyltransferase [Natronobacillus azotifigens]